MQEVENKPVVSVIIPTYNRAHLLCEAIDSIIEQNIFGVQVIVVDDGSTEDILTVVKRYNNLRDKGIKIDYMRQAHAGANAARSLGMNLANGKYIQFLDSDDILFPGKWKNQLKHFVAKPYLDASVSSTWIGRDISSCVQADPLGAYKINAVNFILGKCSFKTAAPLWINNALKTLGDWPAELKSSQDWEFHLRALLKGMKLSYMTSTGYLIRIHDGQRIGDRGVTEKALANICAVNHAFEKSTKKMMRCKLRIKLLLAFTVLRLFIVSLRRGTNSQRKEAVMLLIDFLKIF